MNDSFRLDTAMVQRGLAKSRETAKEFLSRNAVTVNGVLQKKASFRVYENDRIECCAHSEFVGRGGLKLQGALEAFSVSLENALCLDAGASTGGFTDCMIRHGANTVYAVEGGHAQLSELLKKDHRVKSFEDTDIRNMPSVITDNRFDFIAGDLSFISLKIVIPFLFPLLKENGSSVLLIKPQFEAGRTAIGKKGIVKSPKDHIRVLNEITDFVRQQGFSVGGLIPSPIQGGSGNIEYLLFCGRKMADMLPDTAQIVKKALTSSL